MEHRLPGVGGATALAFAAAFLAAPGARPLLPVTEYIRRTWDVLTRSSRDLAISAADPKLRLPADGRWPVYVSRTEDRKRVIHTLRAVINANDFAKIELRTLPAGAAQIAEPGLLYLPRPYAVPGGRFNEMYGWDSFFISLGLIRDGKTDLARDMADNFLYEIREYGTILNANRTYYLSRSQPPFLTEMLLAVFERTHDRKWLEDAVPAIEKYYRYWTTEPHLTPTTGLSRYFDSGDGPAPEVVAAEGDLHGRNEYDLIAQYFSSHRVTDYDASQYYDASTGKLTAAFYKGDRSMRESGFDPSNRFGPFSADIVHYNPVCLNSLLYAMEVQTAQILDTLSHPREAARWRERARDRAARIDRYLWDSDSGLYFDYNFAEGKVRRYPFLTTFYPLWTGVASHEQADRVVHSLPLFERPGGLQTSTTRSGDQWDAPFGWAPLQWIAVQGLRRYGYQREADRISKSFLSLVVQEYEKHGTIVEKYDVVHRRSDIARNLHYGYRSNEAGFGWTNAVFTALLDGLPADKQLEVVAGH
jgi:alpha,alpha-trehalase